MKGENWTLEMLSRYLWERVRSAYLALPPADRQSPPEPLSSLTITLSDGPDPLATSASFEGPLDTPQSGAAALLPPIAFNVDLIASAEVKAIVRRCLDSKERGGWAAIEKELTAYLLNKETARLSGQTDDRDGRKESTTPTGWQHMASEGATPRWIRDLLRWTSPGHMLFYSRCFPSSMVSRIVMPGRGGVMMVGGEAFIGEGGRGPQYERLREAWKVLGGGEKELVVIDDPEVIDSSVRAISHAIKGVSLTPLPTSPSTLEQSLASLIKCAPPQSTFHFDPLAYLSAKKAIDCHAFNEDTWEAFVARFREKEPRDCGVRVLDVGAGTLGMLVRVLGLWEGHQWKGRGDALVYVAVDTSRAVMQANRESATELMGFEEVDESFGFHPRERVYRKADRGGGTIYLVLVEGDLLDTADGQHGFDVVLGCSFADLMDQDVLINHLTRIARGALLYMPITYAGRTIFDPPFFGGGALPTDRQVVSLYHEHLRREGQSTDPSKLVRAIESRKGQIMMQGASEWSVPFADHKYMWQCLMSFLAMGALKSCELLPHWDLPAWVKHHTDKQSTVQVKNVDILGTLPADVAAAFPSRQVVFSGPSRVELRDRPQATKVPPGHVEVESAYSLISSGTELKVYQGDFIEGEPLDTAIEGMTATPLRYPLTYGYSLAGKCVRCGSGVDRLSWLGQKVFAFHSHEERAIVPLSSCTRLPPDVPVDDAIFLPAMETALSLLQDASPVPGEQVAVFGQGLIGLLVTYLLARQRWHVTAIDPSEQRRRLAREAGASAVLAPSSAHDPPSPFDCVIEVSGRPTALDGALRVTRDNGRVVVGSWYSKGFAGFAELDLGSLRLHRSHIQIKFSQVSEIPPSLRGRWTKDLLARLHWKGTE
ncbi:unnamed protein product [Vitrella brassicaformis CCMP3155]|uniref:Alcohol dehydrogenase-like C-terminal domain-containing protein n=1 Tax=Vitrella brassicaformis (strain CCMP3155) TaxID=1169540 RepID=A0A0G4GX39_VITBC|nr:unnamed protein product [Vitrella brassicaformis CCMP3155]|eukprot:CEM35485.1 unnamed protein product [Vitrella brassicaformis CCMP3155]